MQKFLLAFILCAFVKAVAQPCPQLSTYFGRSQSDGIAGICKDTKGNTYAIGSTSSNDLPTTAGVFQTVFKNGTDAFVAKFDSCSNLIWCSYFGSTGDDWGQKIAYSESDSTIVFTGYTDGTDLDTTFNCFQPVSNGLNECFIAKFNLNGQAKWVTYFGAANADFSYAITVDQKGNIIIGGTSLSTTIHTNAQSFQQNLSGAVDAFVARFNSNGQLKFSTFYGGTSAEDIHDIATDADGNIIGVGGSFSNNLNTSVGCLQPSSNGGMEIYVIKLDSVGNRLFSTYIGGTGVDDCYGVCTDPQKNIYLTGHTSSNDFYKTAISHQTVITGNNDNYCLKLTPTGTLVWSNIFGGSSFDNNAHCRIDANNNIYTLINSQSTDFPMLGTGNYTVNNGSNEVVVAKINSNGQFIWSTFKGGSGGDVPGDLILFKNKIVVAGATASSDFPVIANNYQLTNGGQDDGFLSSINATISLNIAIKEFANENCEPHIIYSANVPQLFIPCHTICKIMVCDVLGRNVQELQWNSSLLELQNLNKNELYFIAGFDTNKSRKFIFKLFLSDSGL